MGPAHSLTQRLRAMIFELADGEQRRNSATADGRCPILMSMNAEDGVKSFLVTFIEPQFVPVSKVKMRPQSATLVLCRRNWMRFALQS